ncbi:MAG: hypothetical protein ACTSYB_04695 [Candidatus Helarchaeota archaeon]
MKKHKVIRWSEVTRQTIEKFPKKLELLDKMDYEEKLKLFDVLFLKSELNEEDIQKLADKVKENIFKRIVTIR